MRIACVYDNRLRPDTTGNYFLWAFQRLGHDVVHMLPDSLRRDGFDLYLKLDDGIKEHCYWDSTCTPSAYYAIDTHYWDAAAWRPKVARQFDRVFCAQKNGVEFFKNHRVSGAKWVPLAADEDLHSPPLEVWPRTHDWAFVGNLSHSDKRLVYLDGMLKAFPNALISDYSYFKDMANVYGRAKVVFNVHINNDINMRFWEGLMSGSVVLTENVSENGQEELGLEELFLTYDSLEDAKRLMGTLTGDDALVSRMGSAARQKALTEHTYKNRAETILREMGLC